MSESAPPRPPAEVLGVPVTPHDLAQVRTAVATWVAARTPRYVTLTGVHGVMEAQRDDAVMSAHRDASLVLADGRPVQLCARWAGLRDARQVRGTDLMRALLADAAQHGWRTFFYGSTPEVLAALEAAARRDHPGLVIAGSYSPPMGELGDDEAAHVRQVIAEAAPDLLWVGLSTPKQELWMQRWADRLGVPVTLGVGAAFDYVAGTQEEAPAWLRPFALEWAFRLAREPRRLWRRYLRNNPAFLAAVLKDRPRLVAEGRSGG